MAGSRVLNIVVSSVLQMRHRTLEAALRPLPGLPPWTFASLRAPLGGLFTLFIYCCFLFFSFFIPAHLMMHQLNQYCCCLKNKKGFYTLLLNFV